MTAEQRQQKNAKSKERYQQNRESVLSRVRAHYRAHKEEKAERVKAYHKKHPDVSRRSWKKHQLLYPERRRSSSRAWYNRNIDAQRIRVSNNRKIAYANNPEKILAANRAWASRNKDKIRLRDMRRRALLKGAEINLKGMIEWMGGIKSKRTFVCYYCDQEHPISMVHFDHIIPLSKGGAHSVENLCASCQPCNCSKQAKQVSAWVRIGQQVLAL